MRYIWLFIMLLCISVVVAEPSYYFEKNKKADLNIPGCRNNNAYCTASATCNITIFYPSGAVFVENQRMKNNIAYFNYSLPDSSVPGDYPTVVDCKDGSLNGYEEFTFRINQSGSAKDNMGLGALFLMFGLAIISLVLLLYFNSVESDLKHMFLITTFLFLTVAAHIGAIQAIDYISWLGSLLSKVYYVLLVITVFIIFIIALEYIVRGILWFTSKKKDNFREGSVL